MKNLSTTASICSAVGLGLNPPAGRRSRGMSAAMLRRSQQKRLQTYLYMSGRPMARTAVAAVARCPSCAKAFSDMEALKCHAWSKRTCRAALPPPLRAEVEAWDQAPVARCVCPGCGRTIAKAHAWTTTGCRSAIPRAMQEAIEAEEAAATLAALTRCPSCTKAFSDVEALKNHAWSKRTFRAALPPPLRAEVEAWEQAPAARCACPGQRDTWCGHA